MLILIRGTFRYHNKEIWEESLSSSFAQHFLNECHDCDISNFSVLHIEHKDYRLDTLEILEIARARENSKTLLSEQLEFNNSPLLKLAIE